MKVLFFCFEFPPIIGGIAQFSYNISEWLSEMGINITVLTPHREKTRFKKGKMRNFPFPSNRFLRITFSVFSLFKQIIVSNYDLILLTDMRVLNIYSCFRFFLPKKYIPVFHGSEILEHLSQGLKRKIKKRYLSSLINNSLVTITVSKYVKKLIFENLCVNPEKLKVIHNGIDTDKFICSYPDFKEAIIEKYNLRGKKVILTIARLVKDKQHKLVIDVLGKYKDLLKNLVYIIVGAGPERGNLELLVKKYSLTKTVFFYGPIGIRDDRKPCFYQLSDIYVMPSITETFGISFLESGAMGVPSIGTNIGGIKEIIEDGKTGFLIKPNEEDMFEKLSLLVKNEKRIKEMRKQVKINIRKKFDKKTISEQWRDVFVKARNKIM